MDRYTALSFSLSGPSGCGKTTIINRLIANGLDIGFSISATNRPPRDGEKHGVNYYFISTEEFQERIVRNEFLEYEEVYPGQFYGTLWSEIDRLADAKKIIFFDVDIAGAEKLKAIRQENHQCMFVHLPYVLAEKRLRIRATECESKIQTRLKKAKSELEAMGARTPIFSNVLNDNGFFAAMQCERFIRRTIVELVPASKAQTSPLG